MDKEEIDKLKDDLKIAIKNQDLSYILEKYLKMEVPKDADAKDFKNEKVLKLWKELMDKIENGDYNYFWQLITNDNIELMNLMIFSSRIDDIKFLVEHREKFQLDTDYVTRLILATKDSKYIEECVENREKLGLKAKNVVELIRETRDAKYIQSCIENRESLGLNIREIIGLIKSTKDVKYVQYCIENREKLGLNVIYMRELIQSTKDVEYIKHCIENREDLELSDVDVGALIRATNDAEYIKNCIRNRKELRLNIFIIRILIKATQDIEYIKHCIANRESLGLDMLDTMNLIMETQDKEYFKECVKNKEKLGLDVLNVMKLVKRTQDKEYIKKCIADRKNLGFDTLNVLDLIKETQDKEYFKECVKNREKFGLNENMTVELILLSGNIDYIIWCEKNIGLDQLNNEKLKRFTNKSNIKLPSDMTVGVEIESEGEKKDNSFLIEKLTKDTEWDTKGDGTLIYGTEVASHILTGDMKKASNEIKNVCAVLNGIPQTVSERCGGHIHIGVDCLKTKKDMVNLIKIWSNVEKILYIISNEKGKIPRKEVLEYAPPASKKFEKAIEAGTINLESEENLEKFVNEVIKAQGDRYSDINFCNIGSKEKNTIEFRLPNGTINPNTWIENVNLFGGIVKVAHELSVIQEKTEEQMTEYEKKLLENFKKLYTEKDEKQRAKALIDLCISPEDRHIYMDRYTTNSLLLDEAPDIKNELLKQISTNKIGEKVFTGENALTGEQYMEGKKIIEDSLIMQNNDKLKN